MRLKWAELVTHMAEGWGAYRIFMVQHEGQRTLGRPRHSWVDNIEMDLQEIEGSVDWMGLTHDKERWCAVMYAVMNLRFP
jgi:hypothetical protein